MAEVSNTQPEGGLRPLAGGLPRTVLGPAEPEPQSLAQSS